MTATTRPDWSAQPGVRLADGRLHLHHGPIDLVVDASGPDRDLALASAERRFQTVLAGLVGELPRLRTPASAQARFDDPIARRMQAAVEAHRADFVTPMAAVAGAVADAVLAAMTAGAALDTAYVNNGGDVAFHLAPGRSIVAAIPGAPPSTARIHARDPVRGVATSGWRGRSFSLGIADSVTVLAESAAAADVAATLIANAVDLPGHPAIERRPAVELAPDSDLGPHLVTVRVGALSDSDVAAALHSGAEKADMMCARGLITAAFLRLDGRTRTIGCAPALASIGRDAR